MTCTKYESYHEDIHDNFLKDFEDSLIFKAFKIVHIMPSSDFERVLTKLISLADDIECTPLEIKECNKFRKTVHDVYFGDNSTLSKKLIFKEYVCDGVEYCSCYYAANFVKVVQYINIWIRFFTDEFIWKNRYYHKYIDESIFLDKPNEDPLLPIFNSIPILKSNPPLKTLIRDVFNTYMTYIDRYDLRLDYFRTKLERSKINTTDIKNFRHSYLNVITSKHSLDEKVTVKLCRCSYCNSTIFTDPKDYMNRSAQFINIKDYSASCQDLLRTNRTRHLINDLQKNKTKLIFYKKNELEFYFQLLHYYAHTGDCSIFIKLYEDDSEYVLYISEIDHIPIVDLLKKEFSKSDKTQEIRNQDIKKDFYFFNREKKKFEIMTYNGDNKNSEGKVIKESTPIYKLSCGHNIGGKLAIICYYIDVDNMYTEDGMPDFHTCPICSNSASIEYCYKHYQQ